MAAGRPIPVTPEERYALNVLLNSRILNLVRSFLNDDRGQGLVEYAIVIATVSLVAIAALNLVGRKANNTLRNVANSLS